ncbi:hypothetical protein KFL_000750130 [Klebsormidium nitens]|uniref:Uncharacterized protein n=1 Tax=Klebsormidium nitens TaxID=105231 RepID=A0A0U9HIY1_KLENI|nr:hypothetical protein KFL_000750130 [Klebsormidium nitens]|eukprot:GAQ81244.1 hypothetical protein KFL_000750130 [Klebsormidium nitens]
MEETQCEIPASLDRFAELLRGTNLSEGPPFEGFAEEEQTLFSWITVQKRAASVTRKFADSFLAVVNEGAKAWWKSDPQNPEVFRMDCVRHSVMISREFTEDMRAQGSPFATDFADGLQKLGASQDDVLWRWAFEFGTLRTSPFSYKSCTGLVKVLVYLEALHRERERELQFLQSKEDLDFNAKQRLESLRKMVEPGGYGPPPEWEAILAAHSTGEKPSKADADKEGKGAVRPGTALGGYDCSTCLTHFSTKQAYVGHFRNTGCKKRKHVVDLSGDSAANGEDTAERAVRRKKTRHAATSAAASGSRGGGDAGDKCRRRSDVPEEELGSKSDAQNADGNDVAQEERTDGVRDERSPDAEARDAGAGAGEGSEGLERSSETEGRGCGTAEAQGAEGSMGLADEEGVEGGKTCADGEEDLEGLRFAKEDLKTGASALAKIMGKFTGQAAKMLVQEL